MESVFLLLHGENFYRNCSLIYLGISSKFQFTCMVQNFGFLPISWTHCASGYFVDPLSSILSPMFWKRLLNTVAFIVPVSSLKMISINGSPFSVRFIDPFLITRAFMVHLVVRRVLLHVFVYWIHSLEVESDLPFFSCC
jgi:hypothetical protein